MKPEKKVKVTVVQKSVFGSLIGGDYEDDNLVAVRDWLNELLEKIPSAYRSTAKIEVDSVGGYEGEHHAEVEVYYFRTETPYERTKRLQEEDAAERLIEREERKQFEALRKKYGS